MIWIALWLGIVFFLFRVLFTGTLKPDSAEDYFFNGLFFSLFCAVSLFLSGLAAVAISYAFAFPSHQIEGEHQRLAAIRDKDGMQGAFFLGSGFVQSQPYYFYYREIEGGGLRPERLNADRSVTVYQENRADAELVIFTRTAVIPAWAWIVCLPLDTDRGHSYGFHVPNGTVKTGFSM